MNLRESYRTLRLQDPSTLDEVKKAYRVLAFQLHPDLNPDDPHAARHFQRVNEAYVLLKRHLETNAQEPPGASPPSGGADEPPGAQAKRQARVYAKAQPSPGAGGRKTVKPPPQPPPRKEDVLHEILKDPFARQVFEDIYSQIRKSGGKDAIKVHKPPVKKKLFFQWGDRNVNLDLTDGVWQGAKSWMRGWLDERQDIHMPAGILRPGSRVRLQVQQGWSGKKVSVELTLPPDYVVGRAIRLKGLGRKFGPLVGDLYVRLFVG